MIYLWNNSIINIFKVDGLKDKVVVEDINTGKTELTKEGYKVYIYQKVESSKGTENPPVVGNKEL